MNERIIFSNACLSEGIESLSENDAVLKEAFKLGSPMQLRLREPGFSNLVSVIVSQQISVAAGTGGEEEVLELVQGRWMSAKLTITTSDTSQSPELLSFAVRGFQLVNDLVVDMPINISDQVERPFRKALRVNGQGDLIYQALRNKEGQNVQLEIFRPDTLLRGIIENVSSPIEEISPRGSVTQYCLVRFRGSKVIATSSSREGLAIGLLGVERLG